MAPEDLQVWQDRITAARSDDAALLRLAHQVPGVELKLAAIQALTQEESFRQAMRDFADQDKRLYRAARAGWQTTSGRRKAAARAAALIENARALLAQDPVPVNRAVELDHAWAALDAELVDEAAKAEFSALNDRLLDVIRAQGESEKAIRSWLAAVDAAIDELKASLGSIAQGESPPSASDAPAAGLLERLGGIPDAGNARCSDQADAGHRALALAASVAQRAAFLAALPDAGAATEAVEKERIDAWRDMPEAADAELQAVLAGRFAGWRNALSAERDREHDTRRKHEQQEKAEQKKQRHEAIERDVAAAEAAQAEGQVAELTRLMVAIDRALKPGPVGAALTRRIDALRAEHQRLRDWQRWSGRHGREQLVAEAQALAAAAAGKIMLKTHAEAIEKLGQRWKELDKLGAPTNQALWLAFDGALKTAYAPVAAHVDKLKAAREENLAARNAIVETLTQAAARHFAPAAEGSPPADAMPDWRAVSKTVEDARVAWRKLGPVEHTIPRKAQKGDRAVTTRYAAALQALEGPLQQACTEATRQREQLIAAAKALVTEEGVVREAVDKVRKLQAQWQAYARTLPLPRRDENALWTAFKSATDAVFTALSASRAARDAEADARTRAREDIVERLTAATSSAAAAELKRAIAEADAAWRAAPEANGPRAAKLDGRYRAARAAATKRLGELAAHAARARFDALLAAAALCGEREAAATPDTQLEARWSARWDAIEGLPDAWRRKLDARWSAAVSAGAPGSGDALRELLLRLEVACEIDSPPQFLAERQQLKLRALKEAMEARRGPVTTREDIEGRLVDAAAMPRPDALSRERLDKLIAAVRSAQR